MQKKLNLSVTSILIMLFALAACGTTCKLTLEQVQKKQQELRERRQEARSKY
jgi:hypothetical protein